MLVRAVEGLVRRIDGGLAQDVHDQRPEGRDQAGNRFGGARAAPAGDHQARDETGDTRPELSARDLTDKVLLIHFCDLLSVI